MIKRAGAKWNVYGEELTREQLSQRIGDMSQVAGIRLIEMSNGNERGVRAAEFNTGAGFMFTVLLDRGMDIDQAKYRGVPVSWQSATGPVHPSFFEPEGISWLYNFQGGLMATVGFTYGGGPSVDQGVPLGLHGRASNTPAKDVCVKQEWQGDHYMMYVEGRIDEAGLFHNSIRCHRRIETRLGETHLRIHDTFENIGFAPSPLQFLYHCNIGWPILSASSQVHINSKEIHPNPGADVQHYRECQEPTEGYAEQVFRHVPQPGPDGMGSAALINPAFNGGEGYGAYVRWTLDTVPFMNQWKMMGRKAYVMGLEPSNLTPRGRGADREDGILRILQPGESVTTLVEIGVLWGKEEIDSWLKQYIK